MGVKDLWDILSPVSDKSSLDVLRNKTVAVDLSGWILQSQKQKELSKWRYAYLRNLFFRISHLLKLGVKPLFIIEGEAPLLKKEVLFQRTQSQEQPSNDICLRRGFRQILNECKELIESLGLTCIQSSGEAEATCAYLNMNKVVDGCITDDSDAFLYGAQMVYRNFSIDPKDPHIDVYKMIDIEKQLNLDRRKLVALALLLGCDYCQAGVPGIGKEKAMELLQNLKNVDVLERFEKWRNGDVFSSIDTSLIKKQLSHCEKCKHPGTVKKHMKDGCEICGNTQDCVDNNSDFHCDCSWHQAHKMKLELSVSERALKIQDPEFPSKEIIKEYLEFNEPISCKVVQWNRPSLTDFEEIITRTLSWTVEKIREKILPLMTYWHIMHIISLSKEHITNKQEISQDFIMEPIRIISECVRKSVKCFKVQWKFTDYPAMKDTIITVEVQSSFKQAYPRLTENYYAEHQKATEKSRKRKEKGITKISKHKQSSKQKKTSTTSSCQIKKVSKDEQGMALSQTVNIDCINVKDIYTPHAQKYSHSEKTKDLAEIYNIPLCQRIKMRNMPHLPANKSIHSSDKSNDYLLKNKLPQTFSCISSTSVSSLYENMDSRHIISGNQLSQFDDDKRNNLSVKQKLCGLFDNISELADDIQNFNLLDNSSSDDSIHECCDDLIDDNDFKHSIICIDSESDDDIPKQRNEISNSVTIFSNFDGMKFESNIVPEECSHKELLLSVNIDSFPEKDEDCYEYSPLPLRERLKLKYL